MLNISRKFKMNITIFIITFNRPKFVDLMAKYFLKRNFNCNLIFIDGSENSFKRENIKIINSYKKKYKKKIKYIFSKNQLKIIHTLAKNVSTRYCLFSYDDDLPGREFVENGIKFLNKNSNFVTLNGNMATANINFSKIGSEISNFKFANVKPLNIIGRSYDQRFLKFNYQEGFAYGVYRKKDFVKIFSVVKKLCENIENPIKKIEHTVSHKLMTITFATYNLLSGNVKASSKLMMTRLNHQFAQTSGIDYYDKLGGWHINDFYKNNDLYNKILSIQLSKFFSKIKTQNILNLIYLHIYMRAGVRLPRFFYHVHKSIQPGQFSISQKISILKNYPQYIFFRINRLFSNLSFYDRLVFLFQNRFEIKSILKFFKN